MTSNSRSNTDAANRGESVLYGPFYVVVLFLTNPKKRPLDGQNGEGKGHKTPTLELDLCSLP